jgi:polysaccharide deacetylase family sporulation protein PdaB
MGIPPAGIIPTRLLYLAGKRTVEELAMWGNRTIRTHTLACAFLFLVMTVCLSGCAMTKEWSRNALSGVDIPEAAAAEPEAEWVVAMPEDTLDTEIVGEPEPMPEASQPPVVEVATPSPEVTDKDKGGQTERKLIALTFDDGPDSKYTAQILDILADNDVKATFFLVGLQVAKYPEVAKRIVDEGHAIGNHSWSHHDLTKLTATARDTEIDKTQQAILEATGVTPQLMRAPYGAISDSVLKTIHDEDMKHVYWTVDTRDWAGTSVADMHKNILKNTHSGAIILMHSFGGRNHALEHTIKLLPSIITELREKGYEFVTVDEMIEAGAAYASVVK